MLCLHESISNSVDVHLDVQNHYPIMEIGPRNDIEPEAIIRKHSVESASHHFAQCHNFCQNRVMKLKLAEIKAVQRKEDDTGTEGLTHNTTRSEKHENLRIFCRFSKMAHNFGWR